MKIKSLIVLFVFLASSLVQPVVAQEEPEDSGTASPDMVFASQNGVELTLEELYGAFSSISPDLRLRYIRDGSKVDTLVKSMLRTKLIAADAERSGYDQDTLIKSRMNLAAEKELAEAWVANLLENAPEGDYEAIANEYYLANPDDFMSQEMVDVSHILVKFENRSADEAFELASSLREKLRSDPSQFNVFIVEYSEDPAKAKNRGRYPLIQRGQMVKPFEDAAFALTEEGEISEPVETTYGYHLIRLNKDIPPEVVPFNQIKSQMIEQAKKQYIADYRYRYIQKTIAEPIELNEAAAEEMVKHYFGDDMDMALGSPE